MPPWELTKDDTPLAYMRWMRRRRVYAYYKAERMNG